MPGKIQKNSLRYLLDYYKIACESSRGTLKGISRNIAGGIPEETR